MTIFFLLPSEIFFFKKPNLYALKMLIKKICNKIPKILEGTGPSLPENAAEPNKLGTNSAMVVAEPADHRGDP